MPRFFISYDIKKSTPDPHSTLLALATDYGLDTWLPVEDGDLVKLPNTTLVGSFALVDEALQAFSRLVNATGKKIGKKVEVEKILIVKSGGLKVKSDKRKRKSQALRLLEIVKKAKR